MVNVNVKFNSRDYLLACEDGQEKELEKLTNELNKKFEKLKSDLGNLGEGKLLLITAIQTMDEMFSIKETMQKLKKHNKEAISGLYFYKKTKVPVAVSKDSNFELVGVHTVTNGSSFVYTGKNIGKQLLKIADPD